MSKIRALLSGPLKREKVQPERTMGRVVYDRNRCTKCHLCLRVCPTGALSLADDGFINLEDERCIRCSLCTRICPTGALRMVKE